MSRVVWWAVAIVAVLVAGIVTAITFKDHHASQQSRVLGEQFSAGGDANSGKAPPSASNNGCGNGNVGSTGRKNCSNPGHPLNVTGTVLGALYPGGDPAILRVTVANPNNQDLQLQSIDVSLGSPSKVGCQSGWFSVQQYTGPTTTVPKQSSIDIDLDLTMSNAGQSQDACRSATFPINFTASATGA